MHLFKKAIILLAVGTLLHLQVPHLGQADDDPPKITENKPQFSGTAEEFLPGASSSSSRKPFNKNLIWIAAGAAAVLAVVIGASGSGGSSDRSSENQEPGGVSVEW
jgi:hypothetical protein